MKKEYVVLLHGLAINTLYMSRLEKALATNGYQTLNIDYPSRKFSISEISKMIFKQLESLSQQMKPKVHFVAFSMGCLVVRELLGKYSIPNVGNIVLIGPPNQGSQVADFFENNILYKSYFGPAGKELTTHYAKNTPFPNLNHPFGIIAGSICLDPISYFLLPQGNDGKVTIDSTKLVGMKDHIVLPISHTLLVFSSTVIKQVIHFLKHRRFNHSKTSLE